MSELGALSTWAQSQGPYTKIAIISVIVIVAGLVILTVIKSPPRSSVVPSLKSAPVLPASPKGASAKHKITPIEDLPVPQGSTRLNANPSRRSAKPDLAHDRTSDELGHTSVTSENQSGGVTAGQIGSVTIRTEHDQ